MNKGNSVLAVVDGVDGVPVVWWVDLGPQIAGMPRLSGAWVLDGTDRAETLRALTATRMTVSTAAGQSVLDEHKVAADRVLDPEATLTAVVTIRDELQGSYEDAAATKRNGRSLTAPRWPALPEPLDVETMEVPSGDSRTSRALGIARWLNELCTAWDAVEDQRLARPYMRTLGGPTARALPVVIRNAHPSVVA